MNLKIPIANKIAKIHYKHLHTKLISHSNSFIRNMSSLSHPNVKRRLKQFTLIHILKKYITL